MAQALYRNRITLTIAFGALIVAAAVLAASAAGDDSPEREAKPAAVPATNMNMALELRDSFIEDVAEELDEDPDRVQGAVRTVVGDWLERYRDLGLVSERQSQALLDCWDGKDCRLPGLAIP